MDGNDAWAVYAAAHTLVDAVRGGSGPRLLHAVTYRVKGHVSVDPAAYRDPQELEAALKTDPIARFATQFKDLGHPSATLDTIRQQALDEVSAALDTAAAAAWPDASAAYSDIQTTGDGQWF